MPSQELIVRTESLGRAYRNTIQRNKRLLNVRICYGVTQLLGHTDVQ